MSRRHPLSSTRARSGDTAFASPPPEGPRDAPASRTPASSQRRELLLLLGDLAGLLRSLLHCALRLLSLLCLLSHVALLMLVRWLSSLLCTRESRCTSFAIQQRDQKKQRPA